VAAPARGGPGLRQGEEERDRQRLAAGAGGLPVHLPGAQRLGGR
jgi:hypothetical protein